ncbi:hypothetical protein OCU04_001315 [Sclerotinia nivalis]|uniref:Spo11/DNA topoisomerase VI subunit A N-terminal domain-containing protein n=1 Tax=Sclerotinia nivalis TaxID=352851 RepID=A0A9X0AYH1_9HELO|nr:hypothetical protein OCU04_001315 [Sclerotinia nivalis]
MDFDLLQDILKDASYSSSQLLHNLPSSRLISETRFVDHSDHSDHSDHRQFAISHDAAHSNNTSLSTSPTSTPVKSENFDPENISVSSYQAGSAISKIEEIYEAMTDCIIGRRKQFSFDLKSRNLSLRNATEDNRELPISRSRVVQFPNASPREAWKFTALLRIVTLSHEALVTGNIITKRDMYYRDPELFTKQAIVDSFVDDIAYTLGLKRDAMNVRQMLAHRTTLFYVFTNLLSHNWCRGSEKLKRLTSRRSNGYW